MSNEVTRSYTDVDPTGASLEVLPRESHVRFVANWNDEHSSFVSVHLSRSDIRELIEVLTEWDNSAADNG